MNGRFPQLTWFLATIGIVWLGLLAVGKSEPAPSTVSADANRTSDGQTNPSAIGGKQLLERARKVLLKRKSVQARVRLQVHMLDVELVGSGTYLQLTAETGTRFRWRLRTQVAGTTSSLVQVADGRFLWTDQILPSGQTVTRVDLRRLGGDRLPNGPRDASSLPVAGGSQPFSNPGVVGFAPVLSSGGGMARLLETLAEAYDFEPPRQAMYLSVPIYVADGKRVGHLSGNSDDHKPAAFRTPGRVRVLFGRDDLFPYRLEYYDGDEEGPAASRSSSIAPMLLIEWHDVLLDGSIDPRSFDYDPPAETNWRDVTDEVLKRATVDN